MRIKEALIEAGQDLFLSIDEIDKIDKALTNEYNDSTIDNNIDYIINRTGDPRLVSHIISSHVASLYELESLRLRLITPDIYLTGAGAEPCNSLIEKNGVTYYMIKRTERFGLCKSSPYTNSYDSINVCLDSAVITELPSYIYAQGISIVLENQVYTLMSVKYDTIHKTYVYKARNRRNNNTISIEEFCVVPLPADMYYCEYCGTVKDLDDLEEAQRYGNVCASCIENYFYTCKDCNEIIHIDDVTFIDDEPLCSTCISQYYSVCEECGDLVRDTRLSRDNEGRAFCCDDCLESYHIDDEDDDDNYYINRSCLHNYNFKPILTFYSEEKELYKGGYGVELETVKGLGECLPKISDDKHFYMMSDGSLDNSGVEVATHPATISYHEKSIPWLWLCKEMIKDGFVSHDSRQCGIHIHAGRELFGTDELQQELTVAKIMIIFDKEWDNFIIPFTRRNPDDLREWAKRPSMDVNSNVTVEDVREKVKVKKSGRDRYEAINLQNDNTIEFRIFKGTLKRDTIVASIQFVDLLIKYTKRNSLLKCTQVSLKDLFKNTKKRELKEYLITRNLIQIKGIK